jgi:GTP pyrophosphokinase
LVPFTQPLRSGDQVEILTSKSQSPKAEWVEHVTTSVAKSRLASSLRKDRRQIIALGEKTFNDFIISHGHQPSNEIINRTLVRLGFKNPDEFFYKLGSKGIVLDDNSYRRIFAKSNNNKLMQYLTLGLARPKSDPQLTDNIKESINRKQTYILHTKDGVPNYTIANCCHPIPGDEVLGIVAPNETTVIVHKQECPEAMKIKSSYGSRIVSTIWETDESQAFPVAIEIKGIDRKGMLNDITNIITEKLNINMQSFNIKADKGVFVGKIDIFAHDAQLVEHLCTLLKKIKGLQSAVRIQ